jgi:hypothetical protein
MTDFDQGIIDVIDARIAKATRRRDAFGTITVRDTTGPGAMVTFDGSTAAVPCKIFGHVHCFEGDRVALRLVETTWCVIGTFARRELAEAYDWQIGTSPASATTSATFVDMPNAPTVATFSKRYDGTAIRLSLYTTLWTSVADTDAQVGVRIAGRTGTETASTFTPIDILTGRLQLDVAFVRGTIAGSKRVVIPAGEYTFTARWKRTAGTGELRQDDRDHSTVEADEIFRTTSN